MKAKGTCRLCDVMGLGIEALHESGSIICYRDGGAGMRRDAATGVTTLITNAAKLPERGWRPVDSTRRPWNRPEQA